MYDELVKRLRYRADREDDYYKHGGDIINEAADAIEELSREIDIDNAAMTAMDAAIPRWIPVTERLPENCEDVLAYIERNAWGDGDVPYRKREIAIGYHVNGLWHVDGCSGVDCIAWTPLPEPPKEEREDADS